MALAALSVLLAVVASCGGGGEASDSQRAIATRDLVTTFAPLVYLSGREPWYPMSAARFLANSGLEWDEGPCRYERDVSASASSAALAGSPVRELDASKLGREPAYRVRGLSADCVSPRPGTYSSAQHTRPFDREDRPVGLYLDEGFHLDILTAAQPGRRRVGSDGSLAGVPVYYARDRMGVHGRPGIRLSYWMAFGRGDVPKPEPEAETYHEGDWERVDVLVQIKRPGRYLPVAVHLYEGGDRLHEIPWSDIERDGPGAAHPVVRLARGTHAPRRSSGGCARCIPWRTWRLLRNVRREPWFGYGGGWGSSGNADDTSGPLGPSPFDLGPSPYGPAGTPLKIREAVANR
jgi:hypothetical protein